MVGLQQGSELLAKHDVRSRFFAPPAEFDGCFTTFYHLDLTVDGGGTISDHLQPEWAGIRFFTGSTPVAQLGKSRTNGPRYAASGPSSMPTHFTIGSSRMWGIGFLPLGWCRFFDVDASSLANFTTDGEQHAAFSRFAPLVEVLCDPACSDQEQYDALVAFMRERMRPGRDDEKVIRVHRAMVDENIGTVAEFAEMAGLSARSLERICARHFGFPPKLLIRRQRFMRSLTTFMLSDDGKWTDAMDAHYHDQAQFSREFRAFMGMSPREYAAKDHPILTAFVKARARIWGSPAQTLDKPD